MVGRQGYKRDRDNATELSHHELMTRGHRGILQVFDLDIPIVAAIQGWAIGGSFQRALLCDMRIAAEGTRFMLPELGYGVIPDTGGMGRLYQICGTGVASDLIFTGRVMDVEEPTDTESFPVLLRPISSMTPPWRWRTRSRRRLW